MGIIDQKLNDYIWKNLSFLEAIFSEKIYKILVRFKEKKDRESFTDTLEAVIEVDNELFEKLEVIYQDHSNGIKEELKLDEIYYNKASTNLRNGEYDKAEFFYNKTLEINPNHAQTYAGLAYIYSKNTKNDLAIEYYSKAIECYEKFSKNNLNYDNFINLNNLKTSLNQAFFLDKKTFNFNLHINKIEIQNFKQYENFSIDFSNKINIIIGQNSTGKTTLLQAITMGLLKEDSSDLKK